MEMQNDPSWQTPTAIKDMPEIEYWERPYIEAFYTLSGSRQVGMGVSAIPISEIIIYCDYFDEPDPELFLYLMQRMDSAYLEEYSKKQESTK